MMNIIATSMLAIVNAVSIRQMTEATCVEGETWNAETMVCDSFCPKGEYFELISKTCMADVGATGVDMRGTCPKGESMNVFGECKPGVDNTRTCPEGETMNVFGECKPGVDNTRTCPEGETFM